MPAGDAIVRHPRVKRICEGEEFLPGIVAFDAPGHTPGSLVFHLTTNALPVIFTGDAAKNRAELISRKVDMSLEIFGAKFDSPIVIAPTGSNRAFHPDAEIAVAKAAKTLHNLRWFQIVDTRGEIEEGKVAHWQVTMKVGFTLD